MILLYLLVHRTLATLVWTHLLKLCNEKKQFCFLSLLLHLYKRLYVVVVEMFQFVCCSSQEGEAQFMANNTSKERKRLLANFTNVHKLFLSPIEGLLLLLLVASCPQGWKKVNFGLLASRITFMSWIRSEGRGRSAKSKE